jgi:hypothetical protein
MGNIRKLHLVSAEQIRLRNAAKCLQGEESDGDKHGCGNVGGEGGDPELGESVRVHKCSQAAMARDGFQELPFLSSRRVLCGVVAVGISIRYSGKVPIRYFCPEFVGPSEILQGDLPNGEYFLYWRDATFSA